MSNEPKPETLELTIDKILRATGGIVIQGDPGGVFRGISTDSRSISKGNLFLPIRGEKFDGHDFIAAAVRGGARGSLVQRGLEGKVKADPEDVVLILVDDTLKALGDIAHFWRNKFRIKVIAVTGSSGKTTTKEMIAGITGPAKKVLKSPGNFNNLIGLPLTLIEIKADHEVAILEMGTNKRGEIERLTRIAKPDVGVITNIGPAHLEGLKSMDEIREEKWDLFNNMEGHGVAIINNDDDFLNSPAGRWRGKTVTFGIKKDADVRAERIMKRGESGMDFILVTKGCSRKIAMSTAGEHNIYNALAAAASSLALGIEYDLICEGLMSFRPINGRMEILKLRNGTFLINDTYNANPQSVSAALSALKYLREEHGSTVIFGDMLELGDRAEELHEGVGSLMAETGVGAIFLKGDLAPAVAKGAIRRGLRNDQICFPENNREIAPHLRSYLKKGDWILVKGSRKMGMEAIVCEITGEFGLKNENIKMRNEK